MQLSTERNRIGTVLIRHEPKTSPLPIAPFNFTAFFTIVHPRIYVPLRVEARVASIFQENSIENGYVVRGNPCPLSTPCALKFPFFPRFFHRPTPRIMRVEDFSERMKGRVWNYVEIMLGGLAWRQVARETTLHSFYLRWTNFLIVVALPFRDTWMPPQTLEFPSISLDVTCLIEIRESVINQSSHSGG